MRTPAIAVEGVFCTRQNERILENANLHVESGDFLALLGPNGGGKTTLLRIILGLITPDIGTVAIFGKPPEQARMHIGYVPQFSAIREDFPATVLDVVLMGAACTTPEHGRKSLFRQMLWPVDTTASTKAMKLLELLGIVDIASHSVKALSGGQRQRLMVARALMGWREDVPFLLLLDEPTASIDAQGKGCFYEVLGSLRGKVTIALVSHDLSMASPFFSHVALVNKTLTMLPGGCPHNDIMRAFLGKHDPDCPLWHITDPNASDCSCHELETSSQIAPVGKPGEGS